MILSHLFKKISRSGTFFLLILFLTGLLNFLQSPFPCSAADEVVMIEGKKISLDRLFRDEANILFIPLDLFCAETNASFRQNKLSKIIIVNSKDITIKLQLQNNLAVVNEKWNYMEAPVQSVENQIIVPLFNMAEYFGLKAEYKGFSPREKPRSNTDELFGFPPAQGTPAQRPSANETPVKSNSNKNIKSSSTEVIQGKPGDYRESRPSYKKNAVLPPDNYQPRQSRAYQGSDYDENRQDKRQKFFVSRNKRKRKKSRPEWSMKGKIGLGLSMGAYRPDGGDLENDIESHLIWGAKASLGISNHWSLEALIEDWEDSADNQIYSNFTIPGSGKLTIQPATFALKCRFLTDSRFKPYIGLGYTRFNVGFSFTDNTSVNYSEKETCWGPSVQMGGEYFINKHVSLSGDFRYHWARLGFDVASLSKFVEIRLHDFMFSGGLNFWFR